MYTPIDRRSIRRRIRHRIRRKVKGTAKRPRLAVFRSTKHIYVQAIDDAEGRTLAASSSRDPELRGKHPHGGNIAAAKAVGELIAGRIKDAGIKRVVFDRGGYLYHGRVKALAEAMRSAGVEF
jgi:large subunit ribosomal protein L18